MPKARLIVVVNSDLNGVHGAQRRQGIEQSHLCFLSALSYSQQAETATTDVAQRILILNVPHVYCSRLCRVCGSIMLRAYMLLLTTKSESIVTTCYVTMAC